VQADGLPPLLGKKSSLRQVNMGQNENNSSMKNIPDKVKGWLVLLGIIAGFIIAFRSEKQLYSVIISAVILVIWLSIAFYVAFSRLPGIFSKKGIYRYENYRWLAFINIGFIFGLLSAFLLFSSNRLYVVDAILGTATPTLNYPTPTVSIPTASPTSTVMPTITPAPTITPIPSTPTPSFLFQDDFLNNENGWNLPVSSSFYSYSANAKIFGGKLQYGLSCSSTYAYLCESWLQVPYVTAKNFDMTFESKMTSLANDAALNIGIKFRSNANGFYLINISSKGTVRISLQGNSTNGFLTDNIFTKNIKRNLSETNYFRVVVQDSLFVIYANDFEVIRVEDGNIGSTGNIYFGTSVLPNGYFGVIEIDNLKIQNIP
jgi:hypothetical protein